MLLLLQEAAGQMRRSPFQFASVGGMSPTLWVARGYAVLDGPTLPIVAEGDDEPNDSFIEQLTGVAIYDSCIEQLTGVAMYDSCIEQLTAVGMCVWGGSVYVVGWGIGGE